MSMAVASFRRTLLGEYAGCRQGDSKQQLVWIFCGEKVDSPPMVNSMANRHIIMYLIVFADVHNASSQCHWTAAAILHTPIQVPFGASSYMCICGYVYIYEYRIIIICPHVYQQVDLLLDPLVSLTLFSQVFLPHFWCLYSMNLVQIADIYYM